MEKTNIRVNNLFLITDKGKFYLSDIDDYEYWIQLKKSEIKEHKQGEITNEIQKLQIKNKIKSNVNFYGFTNTKKDTIVNVTKVGG